MNKTGPWIHFKNSAALKWFVGLTVIVGLGAGAKLFSLVEASKQAPVKELEQTVRRSTIKIDFIGDGQISLPVKYLDFEVRGKVKEIAVMPGQTVKKGEKLAELDTSTYTDQITKAEIEYQKSQVNLRNVAGQSGLNLLTAPSKIINALTSVGSIQSANLNVQSAKQSLETAKETIAKGVLHAPADGKILYIAKKIGDTTGGVTGNSDSNTADATNFIAFLDSDKVYVKSDISETDIKNIRMGQAVKATIDAIEEESLPGKVVAIDNMPQIDSNGVVTYTVTAQLDTKTDVLKEGMTSVISFILREKENVLTVPNKAVKSDAGRQYVEVKDKDGNITQKTVQTGLSDGENVEVITGLTAGEKIIVGEAKS